MQATVLDLEVNRRDVVLNSDSMGPCCEKWITNLFSAHKYSTSAGVKIIECMLSWTTQMINWLCFLLLMVLTLSPVQAWRVASLIHWTTFTLPENCNVGRICFTWCSKPSTSSVKQYLTAMHVHWCQGACMNAMFECSGSSICAWGCLSDQCCFLPHKIHYSGIAWQVYLLLLMTGHGCAWLMEQCGSREAQQSSNNCGHPGSKLQSRPKHFEVHTGLHQVGSTLICVIMSHWECTKRQIEVNLAELVA